MGAKTYRCYVKYQSEQKWRDKDGKYRKRTRNRRGPYIFVNAMSRESAISFMEMKHVKPKGKEEVVGVVATVWKEDKALRAMGAKELPLDFG